MGKIVTYEVVQLGQVCLGWHGTVTVECRKFKVLEENTWTLLLKNVNFWTLKIKSLFRDEKLVGTFKTCRIWNISVNFTNLRCDLCVEITEVSLNQWKTTLIYYLEQLYNLLLLILAHWLSRLLYSIRVFRWYMWGERSHFSNKS